MTNAVELPGDLNHPLIAKPEYADWERSFDTFPRPRSTVRLIVCSDERTMTTESREALAQRYNIDPNQRYNRSFGGTHGLAHIAGGAIAAVSGKEALAPYANNFKKFATETRNIIVADAKLGAQEGKGGIIPVDHSDTHSEHNVSGLSMNTEGGLGCAFNKLFGDIMSEETTNPEIQEEARKEFRQDVNSDTTAFERALQGLKDAREVLLSNDPSYSVTREDAAELADKDADGNPLAAILEGEHFGVDQVVEIADYVPESNAEPNSERPAFVTNMTDTTLYLCRAFERQGIKLDPEIVFAALIIQRAAVRFKLAGNQARRMAHTSRGNAQEGLAYIRKELSWN